MKRKLLLAMLFVASAIGFKANAQASYNHTYTDGVTVAAGTDFFLYNIGAGMFLTDGMDWGTHATADHAGRKITFAALADGKYSIYTESYSLNEGQEAKKGYMTTNGYLDTGTNNANWVFTPVSLAGYTNVYTIKNSDTQYLIFNKSDCRVQVTNSTNDNYSYWIIIPKSARNTVGDYTYYLMNTDMNRPWERKVWSGSKANDNNVIAVGGNDGNRCAEKFHVVKDIYQTIAASVPNGRYRVSAQGFWRQDGSSAGPVLYANKNTKELAGFNAKGEGTTADMAGASTSFSAGLYINSVETVVTDGKLKVGINITAADQWVIFDNFNLDYLGTCLVNDAIVLPDGGTMEPDTWYYFDIETAADDYNANATDLSKIICTNDGTQLTVSATGNVTLKATANSFAATRYYVKSSSANTLAIEGSAPSAAEKKALADAIEAAEAKIIGFENGEYAPYNNIDAMAKLAAAKAINPETAVKATVVAATTALTGATWTANVGEVNAIYWKTDYTKGDKAGDGYVHPIGWTNTGYNTRIMNKDLTGDAAMTTIGTAVFSKYNTTYGEVAGYTLPLKPGKIYKITFKHCGWGNNPTTNIVLTDPSDNTITLAPGFKAATNDGNANAEHWYDYTGYFVSTTAGDYVLAMNKVESGQQQIAWADMELVSATELEFADGSVPTYAPGTYPTVKITRELTADKWASAIYPFAVSATGLTVATLTDFTDNKLVFTSGASTANKPFLMKSASTLTEISLSNVEVAAAAASSVVEGDVTFTGKYATVEIDNSAVNYVLSNNTLMKVGDLGATINPYRAYFTVAGTSPVKPLSFVVDGTATGVDSVEAVEAEEDGVLYNTAGQQVTEDYKGIVIKNGKKYYQK